MAARISWITFAPVKGMRIQSVEVVDLTPSGVSGDRAFFVADSEGAMVNGKRLGSLMEIVPQHDSGSGVLRLVFPGGSMVEGPVETGNPERVTFFGKEENACPVSGDFSDAISAHTGQKFRLMVSPDERGGTDRGKWGGVSLLGQASLDALREAGRKFNCAQEPAATGGTDPGPIDQRRFRMNFGIEGIDSYEEDSWIGREIRVGGATVRVAGHVGRCATTTRDPESGKTDLKTLHFLKCSRDDVESFEPLPFGIYGEVIDPGPVRISDPVGPAST
ncbi:MAG TPA: MOSC N-terminal beta barrel domain-containing protein [Solirubrobacterales bacterium]|nr:MOSC N-terminal beta barrel domain-containing protein [Solirubrobacterales bacterium]